MTGQANGLPAAALYWVPEAISSQTIDGRIARALGHGRRLVVPTDPGRKNVTLVAVGDLSSVRVELTELRNTEQVEVRPVRLARRLEAKARQFKRLGIKYSRRNVTSAINRLRSLPS